MPQLGMNTDEVLNFANQLSSKADEIEHIINTLTGQLSGVQWLGPDATRFHGDWDGSHRPQLQSVANALREASQIAHSNVSQQVEASNG